MIQYQILQTNTRRTTWKTVRRITNEILGVKRLMKLKFFSLSFLMSVLARFFFNFSKKVCECTCTRSSRIPWIFFLFVAIFFSLCKCIETKNVCGKLLTYACRMALPLQVIYAISFWKMLPFGESRRPWFCGVIWRHFTVCTLIDNDFRPICTRYFIIIC